VDGVTELKAWVRQNSTLVSFLVVQAIALISGGAWALSYMVTLETRVMTMETRGAQYTVAKISRLEERITILEQNIKSNTERLDRLVDKATK